MRNVDNWTKQVSIPVRIRQGGTLAFFYGGDLPQLEEGAIGDLIIPTTSLKDERMLDLLQREEQVKLLDPPATVMALVVVRLEHLNAMSEKERLHLLPLPKGVYQPDGRFVHIQVEEPLILRLRGTKRPDLLPCECTIPSLGNRQVSSLNEARTVLAQTYEKHRRASTGNVFTDIFVETAKNRWVSLNELRDSVFRQVVEYRLLALCRPWFHRPNHHTGEIVWALIGIPKNGLVTAYVVDTGSVIVSERFYRSGTEAESDLKREGFERFEPAEAPSFLRQPEPPYRRINGDEQILSVA